MQNTNLPLELSKEHLPMIPHARFPLVPARVRAAKMCKGDLHNHATAIMLGDLVLQPCIKQCVGGKGRVQAGATVAPSALLLNFHFWLS